MHYVTKSIILKSETTEGLNDQITEYLEKGWVLRDSIQAVKADTGFLFLQYMTITYDIDKQQ